MKVKEIDKESILLEWKPPLDDGGIDLTKYAIERHDATNQSWTKVADVDKDVETYCVQRLNENQEYMFRVMAQNPAGLSEPLQSDKIVIGPLHGKFSELRIQNIKNLNKLMFLDYFRYSFSTGQYARCRNNI